MSTLPRRIVMPLGPWPEPEKLTPAQVAQRRAARQKQIGKTKAPNGRGVKRT